MPLRGVLGVNKFEICSRGTAFGVESLGFWAVGCFSLGLFEGFCLRRELEGFFSVKRLALGLGLAAVEFGCIFKIFILDF